MSALSMRACDRRWMIGAGRTDRHCSPYSRTIAAAALIRIRDTNSLVDFSAMIAVVG